LGAALSLKLKESSVRSSSIHIAKVFWSFLSKLGKLQAFGADLLNRQLLPIKTLFSAPQTGGSWNRS
jgi:hypothetical protein